MFRLSRSRVQSDTSGAQFDLSQGVTAESEMLLFVDVNRHLIRLITIIKQCLLAQL
jgi:hypothetical protein